MLKELNNKVTTNSLAEGFLSLTLATSHHHQRTEEVFVSFLSSLLLPILIQCSGSSNSGQLYHFLAFICPRKQCETVRCLDVREEALKKQHKALQLFFPSIGLANFYLTTTTRVVFQANFLASLLPDS